MSTRVDGIALRSLFFLSAMLCIVIWIRFGSAGFGKWAAAEVERRASDSKPENSRSLDQRPKPISPTIVTKIPAEAEQPSVSATPRVAITPWPAPRRITRLRVEPGRWSSPLIVPAGERVGIKFSLGRIEVERDGVPAGRIFRNPTVVSERDAVTIRPLASLNRTPRVFWFERGVRVLRFASSEKKQSEEIEVLWEM